MGWTVALKFLPNALLSSKRSAPVTYSRSLKVISCSTKPPTERVSTVVSGASVLPAPMIVSEPPAARGPVANVPLA